MMMRFLLNIPAIFPVLLLLAGTAAAQEDFAAWLAVLRREAAAQGISEATLEMALGSLQPLPRVVEADRKQPEFTRTFRSYAEAVVSERRVRAARERLQENRRMLDKIAATYGVPPRILIALWGVESFFGTYTGGFHVVPALATLAWEGRRAAFFRSELLEALRILDQGHIAPEAMTGSWAGAMGQFQFMPSTFRRFAVDHDGDGRKDIWSNRGDAIASAANYLNKAGWKRGMGWGQQVRLPRGFNHALAGLDTRRTYAQWRRLGVKGVQGPAGRSSSLLLPDGPGGPAFLATDNFRVLLAWNRSSSFALSVGLLADRLPTPAKQPAQKAATPASPPPTQPAKSPAKAEGADPGTIKVQ